MSHIHLPDGVIPTFWWVIGYILASAVLAFAFYQTKSTNIQRKVPLLGMMAALMLVSQSIPLGPIPFHLNLAVLSGIILGPWLGLIAVFISNLFLAFVGHGGITVVGLNTLVVGSEAILGSFLFAILRKQMLSVMIAAMLTTFITLIVSISLMVGIVALSQVNPAFILGERAGGGPAIKLSIPRFVMIIAPFATIGTIIESLITGLVVRFITVVRSDIL